MSDMSFDVALANQMGIITADLEDILDRNPDLPVVVRARLARTIGKCIPLTEVEYVRRLSSAFQA